MNLVDTLTDEPIECTNPKGIKTSQQEYEFDVLIYATGFDGVTGAFDRIDIRGTNGVRLKDFAGAEKARAPILGCSRKVFRLEFDSNRSGNTLAFLTDDIGRSGHRQAA